MTLAEIMKEKGISSKTLAEKTGIPVGTINEYRNPSRKKEPSFSRGMLISDALEIDPHLLMEMWGKGSD